MSEQRAGRRFKPLPANLPPARKRFALELRRYAAESGLTLRELTERAGMSLSSISRALNGDRILTEAQLQSLGQSLGLNEPQLDTLLFLCRQAKSETHAQHKHGDDGASEDLADRLATLRREAGLSVREIADRLSLMGTPVAKSTVERTLRAPDRSLLLALQVANVLIDVLPEADRGPAAEGVFRIILTGAPLHIGTGEGSAHLVLHAGSGKSASVMLPTLYAGAALPSDVTVAALARKLDLPVQALLALRRAAAAKPGTEHSQPPGRPIREWSPLELEVHPAPYPSRPGRGGGTELPTYIPRAHDQTLAEAVRDTAAGNSQMVVLVGSASTGKTRACWEAVQSLAEQGWRLWHPFNPTRPEAVLEGVDRVQPRTVVWLNEAQHYLLPPGLGEQVAAALHDLLSRPDRGPILVLGTVWPDYLAQLTAVPASGEPDLHAQARRLLIGRTIFVPDTFTPEAMRSAEVLAQSDPRLAEAAAQSGTNGRLAQYLASAPQLVDRYHTSTLAARAVLHAAMDACRLGVSNPLPQSFLTDAATGYLTDPEYDMLTEDWAEQAFAELARPVAGNPGPLSRVRNRPATRPGHSQAPGTAPMRSPGATFRLADYLEQYGRIARQLQCPPASFWHAGYTHLTAPEDLYSLARAAYDRYRLQWAHYLRRRAAEVGDDHGLIRLVRMREETGDRFGADELARQAADAGDTFALRELARMREAEGDYESAQSLARQAADLGDVFALTGLARTLEAAGDHFGAERLARQAADAGDTFALRELARMREAAGVRSGAETLYRQAADAGDGHALIRLAHMREAAGDRPGAEALYLKAADSGGRQALIRLAQMREEAGDFDTTEVLARQAADASDTRPLATARAREVAGDYAGAEALYLQAADAGDDFALIRLAQMREETGDRSGAETLYLKAAEAGNTFALVSLAQMREETGDRSGAETLYLKAADAGLAWLVDPASRWPYGLDPDGTPTLPWE
ncbi:helix-turn-helix domain-containing protein [Streptomyces microflavus]|uniref:helix-turn-helix domain-containing protein n=1 Tax=Streptomyces microflavus TaxID=1919 RepID=UPI00368DDFF0